MGGKSMSDKNLIFKLKSPRSQDYLIPMYIVEFPSMETLPEIGNDTVIYSVPTKEDPNVRQAYVWDCGEYVGLYKYTYSNRIEFVKEVND